MLKGVPKCDSALRGAIKSRLLHRIPIMGTQVSEVLVLMVMAEVLLGIQAGLDSKHPSQPTMLCVLFL